MLPQPKLTIHQTPSEEQYFADLEAEAAAEVECRRFLRGQVHGILAALHQSSHTLRTRTVEQITDGSLLVRLVITPRPEGVAPTPSAVAVARPQQERRTAMESAILHVCKTPLMCKIIARRIGRKYDSNLRGYLAAMVQRGTLKRASAGGYIAAFIPTNEPR